MEALIYTEDDREFTALKAVLEESGYVTARDPLDGHGHYEYGYPLVVVALEGARGMNVAAEYAARYPETRIIWISSDPYFAKTALQFHVYRFLKRPYTTEQFRDSLKDAQTKRTEGRSWHFRPSGKKAGMSF